MRIFKNLTLILMFLVSACAKDTLILKGSDGSEIPPAFASFTGIPIPEPSYIDLEETRALGYGENWSGTLIFTTPFPTHQTNVINM